MSDLAEKKHIKGFFSVSPLMIFPNKLGKFKVFLKQGNSFVLYSSEDEKFTERHKQQLYETGIAEVYIQATEKNIYKRYVEDNLGDFLQDERVPVNERASVLYNTSVAVLEKTYNEKLPGSISSEHLDRLSQLIRNSIEFMCRKDSLKSIGEFISHDYHTYTHCVHVFMYGVSLLKYLGFNKEDLFEIGLGAMLHDIGKTRIPKDILAKPGKLTSTERVTINQHPVQGVALCSQLTLRHSALNCILFHHERMDGKGYPSGMQGEEIPIPVRVITLCDVYDALTSNRPYAKAVNPYQALRIMRDDMEGAFDMELFKGFISMLSGAKIV